MSTWETRRVLRKCVFTNLDDSSVSDCDDTHSCTDDAIPASCTPGSALRVGNTGQTFIFCREPNLSVRLCHFLKQTLIPNLLWMCAVTRRKREIVWFQVLVALPLWEIRMDLYNERFWDERRTGLSRVGSQRTNLSLRGSIQAAFRRLRGYRGH